jgi:hypothetical protein
MTDFTHSYNIDTNNHHTYDSSHDDNLSHSYNIDRHHIHDLSYDDRYRAIISEISYSAPSDTYDISSTDRVNDAIHNAQINHPEYANQLSHLDVIDSNYDTVFLKDTTNNTCYLISRGTDLNPGQHTLVRDVYNDTMIINGNSPHRVITTENQLIHQMHDHPECTKWEAIGHSLGGRVVEDIGTRHHDVKVTSFEASRMMIDKDNVKNLFSGHKHDNITSHKVILDSIAVGISPGHTVNHIVHYDNLLDNLNPLKNHTIHNYTY